MTNASAWRSLRRAPVYAIAMWLTLCLGIGSVATMFAVLHGVLLAPLPYAESERLVDIRLEAAEHRLGLAPGLQLGWARHARSLDGIGLYRTGSSNLRSPGEGADAESVTATWVSASLFPLLRVAPLFGRTFSADEERRGGPNAVILSEAEWRSRFDASPDVLGQTLVVNDASRVIVGVMPAGFAFPSAATRVWLPVKRVDDTTLGDFFHAGVARLAPGAGIAQAQAELAALLPRVAQEFPRLATGAATASWLAEVQPRPVVQGLRERLTDDIAGMLWMLAAAAALVLLVAWANAANLMLVRADAGQLELAVRRSLGASRWRIASHFLREALLLGVAAGAFALLAAQAAVRALVAFGPAGVPRLETLDVGAAGAGFVALVTLASVLLCAAVPALRGERASLARRLVDGARGQSPGRSRQRLRAGISVLQIAVALAVSIGSALLLRTAQRLAETDPGFDARDVTTLRTLLPYARYRDADMLAFHARLTAQVTALPGVQAAGLVLQLPLAGGAPPEQRFRPEGAPGTLTLPVNIVGNGYFAAMRIPLLAGRDFKPLDQAPSAELIVSRRAAALLFGEDEAAAVLGRRLKLADDDPGHTIIGVVDDVRDQDLASAPSALVYRPQALARVAGQEPGPRPSLTLVVRSRESPAAVVAAVRRIVRALDPSVPLFDVRTLDAVLDASTARLTLMLTLMGAAAAITLAIGGIGLYGLLAYLVALRTREFGVRVALGADPRRVARMVIARGLALAACGVCLGFVLHALAAPFLRAFLHGVSASDPATLALATLVVVATAALASWLPARRAARVDPMLALRAE